MGIWRKKVVTGVDDIDMQHKTIISKLNELILVCENPSNKENIYLLLKSLESSFAEHVKMEENLMIKYGFPDYDSHCFIHKTILFMISSLKNQFFCRIFGQTHLAQVFKVLANWISLHMKDEDKTFGEFLRRHTCAKDSTVDRIKECLQGLKNIDIK